MTTQAEEQDSDLNSVLLGFTNYVMNERVRAYNEGVDATIERCAQVVNKFYYIYTRDELITAIRTLKDS